MIDSSKIYGIVGVNGSGKTTMLNRMILNARKSGFNVISADFSDGIRDFISFLYSGSTSVDCFANIGESCLESWKNHSMNRITVPNQNYPMEINGRKLLERVGEGIKIFAGNDVWAKYTTKIVEDKLFSNVSSSIIIFGSVRYRVEIEAMLSLAKRINRECEFVYCNYNEAKYRDNVHTSEMLGNLMTTVKIAHGRIVTDLVMDFLWRDLIP